MRRQVEDLASRQAALALEEAAGDLAGGVRLLDVLAGEREEVEAGALVAGDATAVTSTIVSP